MRAGKRFPTSNIECHIRGWVENGAASFMKGKRHENRRMREINKIKGTSKQST